VAVIAPGSSTVKWSSVGGTSLATPQWAGLIAIANALRAVNGKAALGAPHAALYTNISTVAGTYASTFADITKAAMAVAAPAAARPATTRPPASARRTARRCCPPCPA
jgi:subtilisin family serine protease